MGGLKLRNQGFSLVELIIVIGIVAVLLAIIAPNLTGYLGRSKERQEAVNLKEIENAFTRAFSQVGTEVAQPTTGTWIELTESSVYFDRNAPDINGMKDFARCVAEELEKLPVSRVTNSPYWVRIQDSGVSGYTVEVSNSNVGT